MPANDEFLLTFLDRQIRDHGARAEIDAGLWSLFVVPAGDSRANATAHSLLKNAPFVHEAGASTDDQWTIYFVDTANRFAAVEWLDDLRAQATGNIRPVTAVHKAFIRDVIATDKPHRAAQQLAEYHARGEVTAGLIAEPASVRSLLDRLHQREPLFFSALLTLLNHHLVDLVVLLRQMIPEDVALKNEIVKGGLSRDPFLQSRQDAAVEIRNLLLRYQLINPIDQQKNVSISNPYAVDLEIVAEGGQLTLPIGGNPIGVPREKFLEAIHTIRRNLYRGDQFSSFDTQAPWMKADIAYAFRFIKQRIDARTDLTPMDALYMLERAVA